MNDLLKLQKNFGEHILNKKKSAILKSLPYARQDSLARLDIYRNNIFDFSYSAFSAIFPVVKKICGEEKFQKLFEKYLKKHHIKTGNLNDCGNDFPKFLKKTKPQFLSDLAQLELFYHLSYYTGEAFDFDLENFQKILEDRASCAKISWTFLWLPLSVYNAILSFYLCFFLVLNVFHTVQS